MLAEALLAVGAFYAARRFDASTPTGEALRHPLDSLRAGRRWIRGRSERLTRAFGAGVQAFRAALIEPPTDVASRVNESGAKCGHAGRRRAAEKKTLVPQRSAAAGNHYRPALIELDSPRRTGRITGQIRRWALAWSRRTIERRLGARAPPRIATRRRSASVRKANATARRTARRRSSGA